MVGDREYNKTKYRKSEDEVETGRMWYNDNSEDENDKEDYND
jgi:hypothetical protein